MDFLKANWPAPSYVHALTTKKNKGHRLGPYQSNNLALHVGDDPNLVQANRLDLKTALHLSHEPFWLNQTHSTDCIVVEKATHQNADAAITRKIGQPLVIMTADCMPILICNTQDKEIAAIHAGWRGLQQGIIQNTIKHMQSPVSSMMAWIGPMICEHCFEVGDDVRVPFIEQNTAFSTAFKPHGEKWLLNMGLIAHMILKDLGVSAVFNSKACTFEQDEEFYSYRKNKISGRIASLIWMSES